MSTHQPHADVQPSRRAAPVPDRATVTAVYTDLLQSMGFGAAAAATGGVCVGFRWIPKEEKFYGDFLALADELKKGARLLEEMLAPDRPTWDKADEIKEVEHK